MQNDIKDINEMIISATREKCSRSKSMWLVDNILEKKISVEDLSTKELWSIVWSCVELSARDIINSPNNYTGFYKKVLSILKKRGEPIFWGQIDKSSLISATINGTTEFYFVERERVYCSFFSVDADLYRGLPIQLKLGEFFVAKCIEGKDELKVVKMVICWW